MEAKDWEIWVKVGDGLPISVQMPNTATVGAFFSVLKAKFADELTGIGVTKLVVRAPHEPLPEGTDPTTVKPAEFTQALDNPKLTLAAVLKPTIAGAKEYDVYVQLPAKPKEEGATIYFEPNGDAEVQGVVKAYGLVGAHLHTTAEIHQMKTVIESITKMRPKTQPSSGLDEKTAAGLMPFVMFEGSSMMGKTQSFWSLSHQSAMPTLYIPVSSSQQKLHKAFAGFNVTLRRCLEEDAKLLPFPPDPEKKVAFKDYEVSVLRELPHKFSTLGFLQTILREVKIAKTESTSWIQTQANLRFEYRGESCSCSELAAEELFVVGLDEIQTLAVAEIQLLRNLLRAAGGIVVVMGTSSSIVNVISSPDKVSREASTLELPWSYLVVDFPKIEPATLKIRCPHLVHDEPARQFLAHVMEPHGIYGNRPGFVVELALALHGNTDPFPRRLCQLIPHLRDVLYNSRPHVVDEFLKNQRRLLSASFAEGDEKAAKVAPNPKKKRKNERNFPAEGLRYVSSEQSLIVHHYAHLSRLGVGYASSSGGWVLHKLHSRLVVEKNTPFLPKIVFPVADDECLLHLLFSHEPFVNPVYPATARHVFTLPSEDAQNDANTNQPANDGMGLEALFCVSAMCASHMRRDSNDQLTLAAFIAQLAYHLIDESKEVALSKTATALLKLFERSIPRFAPPNMCLCDFYDNYLSLGTITRTKNADRMDCVAYGDADEDPIFTGEMKAWSGAVNVGELLERVPRNTTLHIVACNYAPEATSKGRENTLLRTVSVNSGILDFHPMQVDPKDPSCLVLFFVLSEMGLGKSSTN